MKKAFLALCLFAALCLPAQAEPNYNVCFFSLDADGNEAVSKGEFLVAFSDGDMTVFEAADQDKDGSVSHDEWESYKESKGFEDAHGE
ncbi:hypothetical protein GM415_04470 [Pseudodesulfovibrio cashew]|uniref:EF-hand domain-containing protein n=1 Tax=Pseudodesulfovibrio cashew TaxID=2678688 RepID=A0A6I6J9S3_9BACT|nr:hypothetical protein [Pseudodesulfovibrio cashew]QGY39405.1 hypothetical protein GM415_04470 [Pseudodesulfovibrio cashew]